MILWCAFEAKALEPDFPNSDRWCIALSNGIAPSASATIPAASVPIGAGVIGLFGHGVSLVLFVLALRHLGSARTGAYFSTAPFIGALLAIAIFAEPLTLRLLISGLLMGIGLYSHLVERHEHEHVDEAIEHEHRHVHDEHHQHTHGEDDPDGELHTHWHRHAPLTHSHPHYPDLHHRHGHR